MEFCLYLFSPDPTGKVSEFFQKNETKSHYAVKHDGSLLRLVDQL